jgi:general secretion pathway protein G
MRVRRGFTLIELLVVLAIVALMLTIAAPRTIDHLERSRETTLRASLREIRRAIDQFDADTGRLPESIEELVARRYLVDVPVDPVTGRREDWIQVPAAEAAARRSPGDAGPAGSGMGDVRSGAPGLARDGTPYRDW